MMPTVFGSLRVLGVGPDLAIVVHGAVAGAALVVAARVLWRCEDAGLRAVITIMTTLVVTPYWLTCDYTIAAAALVLTCGLSTGSTGVADRRDSLMVLAAMVPIVAIPSWSAGLPLAALLALLGFGVVLWIAARPRALPAGVLR